MPAPVHRLKKQQFVWMNRNKCKHGHNYLEHYSCYLAEHPEEEKVGFIDIETTNLKADFGIMICYSICDDTTGDVTWKSISKKDLRPCLDEKVVKACIKDMRRFDRLIGYYSTKFDIPFIRTRAIALGLEFPAYGEIIHNDLSYTLRNKLNISSNRLDNACRFPLEAENQTLQEGIMASTKSTSKSRPKASNNNDGVGKVIEDLQDRFGKLREDLQADVSDFQKRARDHWDNFAGKFDAKELSKDRERLVQVSWGKARQTYPVSVRIQAYDREGLMRDVSTLVTNEGISMSSVNVATKNSLATFDLVMGIADLSQLSRVLNRLEALPNVLEARRLRPG